MSPAPLVTYRPVDWSTLVAFLTTQIAVAHKDIDHDVRRLTYKAFCEAQVVEGIYRAGTEEMVGFVLWDTDNGHLRNLYVSPAARGLGIASDFLKSHPIETLQVMPGNSAAIELYRRHGFVITTVVVPNRHLMWRNLASAA